MRGPIATSRVLETGLSRYNFCYISCQPTIRRHFISTNPKQPTQPSIEENPVKLSKKDVQHFVPKPLKRPLGLIYPPEAGQNTGIKIDTRSLRQRGRDMVDVDKHMEKQNYLIQEYSKPYFREWHRLNYHEGKIFLCNPRLFRRDKALFFPNLYGRTLSRSTPMQNTTPVLRGKVSLVRIFSSLWAENQTLSFIGQKQNPELHRILDEGGSVVQKIDINIEDNWIKAWLIRMFMWRMRRKLPIEQHDRYFMVRKGFSSQLHEQIGMFNAKVGHVYLLDDTCKIRWAGSSSALPDELVSLNNGLQKLISEKKGQPLPTEPSEVLANSGPSQISQHKEQVAARA
ncbi:Mitochondrial ATPase complex subunit atp10 [Myotisia sp. PD_48]|nr:Mitochondrial ATPase complex subunit atp10 [Myotisia sp. PD_48]